MYCLRKSDRHKSRPSFIQLLCMTKQGRWYRPLWPLLHLAARYRLSLYERWLSSGTKYWRPAPCTKCRSHSLVLFSFFLFFSRVCATPPHCVRECDRESLHSGWKGARRWWFMVKLSMVKAEIKVQSWDMYLHQNGAQSCTRSYQGCRWCCLFRRRGNKSKLDELEAFALVFEICCNLPFH